MGCVAVVVRGPVAPSRPYLLDGEGRGKVKTEWTAEDELRRWQAHQTGVLADAVRGALAEVERLKADLEDARRAAGILGTATHDTNPRLLVEQIERIKAEVARLRRQTVQLQESNAAHREFELTVQRARDTFEQERDEAREWADKMVDVAGCNRERYEQAEARIDAALAIAEDEPGYPNVDWGERLQRVVEALRGGER